MRRGVARIGVSVPLTVEEKLLGDSGGRPGDAVRPRGECQREGLMDICGEGGLTIVPCRGR
jgi:hypothetical protein